MERSEIEELPAGKRKKIDHPSSTSPALVPVAEEIEYADPTMDVTFKMLFGNDKNKDILISLINNLLDFTGEREIVEVEINSGSFDISNVGSDKEKGGIESSIDILCTNKGKQKIAIEMQRKKEKYFLAREQAYMSKLISGFVKEKEGELYHEKILETYIIIIGKSQIFVNDTELKDQKIFEINVKPVVIETGEVVPYNKMNWRFFELLKFKKSDIYKSMGHDSPLKHQWLEFLIECGKSSSNPEGRDEIIKRGYKIMEVANWDTDTQALYWHQRASAAARAETEKEELEEAISKAKAEGEIEGKIKGEIEGKIKGEINTVKILLKEGFDGDQIKPLLVLLNTGKWEGKAGKVISYIDEHKDETSSVIYEELDVMGSSEGNMDLGEL